MPEISAQNVLALTEKLIAIPSVTGSELPVSQYLTGLFKEYGWRAETFPVEKNRYNVFVRFGRPEIVYSTHMDVVPADQEMFVPKYEGDKLIGRGACDAKGILATMIESAKDLLRQNQTGFGLLFVVGEEDDGIGARKASEHLKNEGIRFIINGEPTEGKIYTGHKGAMAFKIKIKGKAAHSGYPELGIDANRALIKAAAALADADMGSDPEMGKASLNIGRISAGEAINIVSPKAEMSGIARIVTSSADVMERIRVHVPAEATIRFYNTSEPVRLLKVPGFETGVAGYSTDIPNFAGLGAQCVLYGPGSIHLAHTDREAITKDEINDALQGYVKIFHYLKSL